MKYLFVAMAVGATALAGVSTASAADKAGAKHTTQSTRSTDISAQHRHHGHRHFGHRHHHWGHHRGYYRPHYRSYGYYPRHGYYGGGPYGYYGGGGPGVTFSFGSGRW
jgi:hypothetical protein